MTFDRPPSMVNGTAGRHGEVSLQGFSFPPSDVTTPLIELTSSSVAGISNLVLAVHIRRHFRRFDRVPNTPQTARLGC
jgi:hypothetical protein